MTIAHHGPPAHRDVKGKSRPCGSALLVAEWHHPRVWFGGSPVPYGYGVGVCLRGFIVKPMLRSLVCSAWVAGLVLMAASPVSGQTMAAGTSLVESLKNIGGPLGSSTGMAALASLASLEVSTAPLGTSTGGFTFTFDPLLRMQKRSASSFGPAFAERSLTTGRGKVSVGFNWLPATYQTFDGQDLRNGEFRPAKNVRGFAPAPDVNYSSLAVHLSSTTLVAYAHAGVTDDFDLGVAIPWVRVSLDANGGLFNGIGINIAPASIPETTSSGIGDIAIFGKYRVWRQPQGGAAVGVELRLPTGDKNEMRGLDVTRTLISGIWSQPGTVSPHANIGYEFWSASVPVYADGSVFVKDQFKYAVGIEITAHPLATVVVDLVGRRVRHGGAVGYETFPGPNNSSIDALVALPEGITQTSLVPGVKINIWRQVLLTGNLLTSLSNKGLRDKVIPVVGIDWAF